MTTVHKIAKLSPCGQYRYQLARVWGTGDALVFVMLNPSTADADVDDPTIRRCMGFAKREGAAGIIVYNLYAFRATSPADMKAAVDPHGPNNDGWLSGLAIWAREAKNPVVCAWGTHADHSTVDRFKQNFIGAPLVCLGTTKDGHPRHPLYVKGDQPLVSFA